MSLRSILLRLRLLLENPPAWESVSWFERGEMYSMHNPTVFQLSLEKWREAILELLTELEDSLSLQETP